MSEIKLFRLNAGTASEIAGSADALEKSLQTLFEKNLETLLGVRFLATEHPTGAVHRGRIDSLGIDENGCPVIVEYKRSISENVVSQGLYYLDWLMDHKAEFELLVLKKFNQKDADAIDWSGPRLICVASDFTKFDEHAIRQINRNIDLVRYKRFGDELLALELATSVSAPAIASTDEPGPKPSGKSTSGDKLLTQVIEEMSDEVRDLYEAARAFIMGLGDDVVEKHLKYYIVYRTIKNFASICFYKSSICFYLKVDPKTVNIEEGYTRDVTNIGHWGTGDLEVSIKGMDDLMKAQELIARSYEAS